MNSYLTSVFKEFQRYETLGRKTMAQLDEDQLFFQFSPEVNSIAILVKHLHGNMLSRWTEFLTTDGEKEWRNRDGEFENSLKTRKDLYLLWTEGWNLVFDAVESLSDSDLEKTVKIRGRKHTVIEAINRQVAHYAYHIGQMVYMAKILSGADWKTLSIPRGGSLEYNKRLKGNE
jgi:hypothetical protein